jgi:hypothetical protein
MIAQLKEQISSMGGDPNKVKQSSLPTYSSNYSATTNASVPGRKPIGIVPTKSVPDLKASKQQLSTEKARAFELFKRSYPASEWIESQKQILKIKYTEAKKLGEAAHSLRDKMSTLYSCRNDEGTIGRSRYSKPQHIKRTASPYGIPVQEIVSESKGIEIGNRALAAFA